jgi:hypothetical protein
VRLIGRAAGQDSGGRPVDLRTRRLRPSRLAGLGLPVAIVVIWGAALCGYALGRSTKPQTVMLVSSSAPVFVPACAHPLYTADGNMTPLFCKIDNPLAVSFYRKIAPKVFALGANASPQRVTRALSATEKHATFPELCAVYKLVSWWRHWHFGISPGQPYCNP